MSARLSDQRCLMPKTLTPKLPDMSDTQARAARAAAPLTFHRAGLATCSASWSRLVTLGGIPDQRRRPRRSWEAHGWGIVADYIGPAMSATPTGDRNFNA
jgi:hypothetical protein